MNKFKQMVARQKYRFSMMIRGESMYSVLEDRQKLQDYLSHAGDPNTIVHGYSLLERAGSLERIEMLLKAGADPNLQNCRGETAFESFLKHSTRVADDSELQLPRAIEIFQEYGADMSQCCENLDVAQNLLRYGAQLTPAAMLSWCMHSGYKKIIFMMVEHSALSQLEALQSLVADLPEAAFYHQNQRSHVLEIVESVIVQRQLADGIKTQENLGVVVRKIHKI